jgi:hydroxypyruvate isomerase
MPTRRAFLAGSAAAACAVTVPGRASHAARAAADETTWLTYAVNVEMFWNKLPFLERLKKVAEAGFTHYEFWQFKTKDIPAIDKASRELNLTPVQFSAYWGITDPKRKEPFLQTVDDAIEVAEVLGVKKLCVVAGEVVKGLEREAMFDAVVDALKSAAEKVKEHDITLILEPLNVLVDHPDQFIVTSKDAAAVIDAVGSANVKILFDVYHQQISEGNLSGNIKKYLPKIGYFQIADHPGRFQPGTGEINYPYVLRLIHDLGYKDVIGLEMKPKGDPMEALKQLREADAAAKAMA